MIEDIKRQFSEIWLQLRHDLSQQFQPSSNDNLISDFRSHYSLSLDGKNNPAIYPAELILQQYQEKKTPRILSIAGGYHSDLNRIQKWLTNGPSFTLFDHDHDALTRSKALLSDIRNNCEFIQGNILRIDREFRDSKPYDLVILGGLFDYIKDTTMSEILTFIWSKLIKDGGVIFFTNSLQEKTLQPYTDQDDDWPAIERNDESLMQLCVAAGIPEQAINIAQDETNRTIIVDSQLI